MRLNREFIGDCCIGAMAGLSMVGVTGLMVAMFVNSDQIGAASAACLPVAILFGLIGTAFD